MLRGNKGSVAVLQWLSKRQKVISLSSTEAEISGIVDGLRTADEVIDLLNFFRIKYKVLLLCDNDAARLAIERGYSSKLSYMSKTRQIHLGWIPLYLWTINAQVSRISTHFNLSDMFTKVLPIQKLQEFLEWIGLVTPPEHIKCG